MRNKARLRKKSSSIRKKKYFEIEPNFFVPLNELIKQKFKKKKSEFI